MRAATPHAVTAGVREVLYLQGAPSHSSTKAQKWGRAKGFISDSEALTDQAEPNSPGKQAIGFLELLSSRQDFYEI